MRVEVHFNITQKSSNSQYFVALKFTDFSCRLSYPDFGNAIILMISAPQ